MINQKDHYGNTPFHYTCYANAWSNTDHCKKLILQSGLLLNVSNDRGRTSFHFACFSLNKELIDDLLANPNVNKNIIDFQGENGLHCIIQCFILKYSLNQIDYYMNSDNVLLQKNPSLVT